MSGCTHWLARGLHSVHLSVRFLFVCPSICLSVCLCVYICLCVCVCVCVCVCLFVCLSVSLSVCLSVCQSVYLFVCLPVCLFLCLLICMFSVSLFDRLFTSSLKLVYFSFSSLSTARLVTIGSVCGVTMAIVWMRVQWMR